MPALAPSWASMDEKKDARGVLNYLGCIKTPLCFTIRKTSREAGEAPDPYQSPRAFHNAGKGQRQLMAIGAAPGV
ncbi:hypothetical protein PSP6_430065 [Paraburkholderia tropica]|nr:hypothetical protein PSP6_430065 [Paraburkholderia tropica]